MATPRLSTNRGITFLDNGGNRFTLPKILKAGMSVYKFRVMYEEDENIFRDIEVRPNQSFADFEDLLITAWGLPAEGKGHFFTSNDRMQKVKAFDHRKPIQKGESQYLPMILNYVDNPHQKFLYEYHGRQDLSFYIELVIIGYEKPGLDYPRIAKSSGPSPVKKEDMYKHIGATSLSSGASEGLDEDDSQLLKGFGTEGDDIVGGAAAADEDDSLDLADDDEEETEDEATDDDAEEGFSRLSGGDEESF